jgi:GST-like protein
MTVLITLYTFTTPNGRKISIMLEELGLPYDVKTINILKNEQFAPDFLAVAPNNKIPAIVDHDAEGGPLSLFESGAILTYLAEKTGKFLAPSGAARFKTLEWLHWQMGGLGPMFGQLGFFGVFAKERMPVPTQRYQSECERLLAVMDRHLSSNDYLAGADYTIADMASYPWVFTVNLHLAPLLGEHVKTHCPAVVRWLDRVGARPAVQRGMKVP